MLAIDKPLITVYIPTFNRSSLLKRAVNSVRSQTYNNLEIIVVDDGSSDDTLDILGKLANEDSRVKFLVNERNSGACFSRNRAILAAQGVFITGLDDDDYFLPDRIENFVKALDLYPNYEVFYSHYLLKTKNSNRFHKRPKPRIVIQEDLLLGNFIGNQIFCSINVLKENLFDINMRIFQDLDCWYRVLADRRSISTQKFDYVIDQSHPHERISDPKKVASALSYLAGKYNLTTKSFITNMLGYSRVPFTAVLKNISNGSQFKVKFWVLIRTLRYRFSKDVT